MATKEKELRAEMSLRLISEEINTILAEVLGKFLVAGSPTKHGGLRFLDIDSAKTFGFERTDEVEGGNLLTISAPIEVKFDDRDPANARLSPTERKKKIEDLKEKTKERVKKAIEKGPYSDTLHQVAVRPSPDPGKMRKLFVEVQYLIPTIQLVSDKNVLAYAEKHGLTNTNDVVKRILREYINPAAKATMDYLITVIRKEK